MKIPFVDFSLYSEAIKSYVPPSDTNETLVSSDHVLLTSSRSSTISPFMIGRTISVHNGKLNKRIKVQENMLGFKLGAFILTKKLGKSIHNSERNKKKKEKMRRKITAKKKRTPSASAKK